MPFLIDYSLRFIALDRLLSKCAALLALNEASLLQLENDETALALWLEPWPGYGGKQPLALTTRS